MMLRTLLPQLLLGLANVAALAGWRSIGTASKARNAVLVYGACAPI